MGTCCRGFAPSVAADALLLLLPQAPAVAFGSPCAKEEVEGEEVDAATAVEEEPAAAATSAALSAGLAAAAEEEEEEEEVQEAGGSVGSGGGCGGLFGAASRSGTLESRLQSPLSPAEGGGVSSAAGKEGGASAASLESPLTAENHDFIFN